MKKELTERWRTAEGADLLIRAVAMLVSGGNLHDLPLRRNGGRLDLRGIVLPSPVNLTELQVPSAYISRTGGALIVGAQRWSGLDMAHARLGSLRLEGTQVSDCVFDEAECRDWRLWNARIEGSRFVKADLRDSNLGAWIDRSGSAWVDVDFSGANLRGNTIEGTTLDRCSFEGADLTRVHFEGCDITESRFAGDLVDVRFDCRPIRGRPRGSLADVDFTQATFHDVEFWGCRLNSVRLPSDVMVVPRAHTVARKQLAILKDDESRAARLVRASLENFLDGPQDKKADGVFSRTDYIQYGEDVADLAERTLHAAIS